MLGRLALAASTISAFAAPAHADWLRFTIVSAKVDPAKVAKGGARSTAQWSDLTCLATPGLRAVESWCGGAARPEGAPLIDPFVRVEIPDRPVRTYAIPGTLAPAWNYSVVFDGGAIDDTGSTAFVLYDAAPGKQQRLGAKTVKTRDLLKPGTRTVAGVGGSSEITYRVEAIDAEAPRSYKLWVPADREMPELLRAGQPLTAPGGSSKQYALVPISEGETVEITATGQVQPSAQKHPQIVAGPSGIPTDQAKVQWNQPGFRGCPGCNHAALIAQLGPNAFIVGPQDRITADTSGLLGFGINDLKVADNAGGFEVEVTISHPKDAGGGTDPRVIQMAIDKHTDELEACVAKEKDPRGRLQLLFSIGADGRPMGVAVEQASPNLKAVGECVQKKAMSWTFPPSHGVTVVRYPLSFQPG